MSALDKVPVNPNLLSQFSWKFSVRKLPYVNFFAQKVELPDVSTTLPLYPNPNTRIPLSPDHLTYTELAVHFKVDEDLRNYEEIYHWIRGLAFPEDTDERAKLTNDSSALPLRSHREKMQNLSSDISLMLLSNHKNPNVEFVYRDAMPTYLSKLQFNHTDDSVEYISATAHFAFVLFDILRLPKVENTI